MLILLLSAMIILPSGCASRKAAWGSLNKGMIMSYAPNPDRELKYESNSSFEQRMSIMNQEFLVTSDMMQILNMKPIVSKDENLEFLVSVEDMSFELETPRGSMKPELDEVIGKSFNLSLDRMGKELEYSGAEAISFDMGTGEKKSISSDIQAFFPDLPGHPVRIGDSWKNTDMITENTGNMEIKLVFNNVNTFVGLEEYLGHDCMKIMMLSEGTMEGKGSQEGLDLSTSGELSSTSTWYYDYRNGIYLGTVVEGKGVTETEVLGGPEPMSIPSERDFSMSIQLMTGK